MKLNLNTNSKLFYRQLLELLRAIPPLDKLRSRELDVVAAFMYFNNRYKNIEDSIKWRIINDTSTRKEMQEMIGMSEDIFNNNLSIVRKAGLINKEGVLKDFLRIYPGLTYKVEFNFKLEDDV